MADVNKPVRNYFDVIKSIIESIIKQKTEIERVYKKQIFRIGLSSGLLTITEEEITEKEQIKKEEKDKDLDVLDSFLENILKYILVLLKKKYLIILNYIHLDFLI
tara:strand:+ start:126 stop:440 length:315 start_codon:yes stop_codon:yes gene_type:complete